MKSIKKDSFMNNYMGKGKEGLEDIEMELNDETNQLSEEPLAQLNKSNIPTFSEGYLYEKFILDNEENEEDKFIENKKLKINSEQVLKSNENIKNIHQIEHLEKDQKSPFDIFDNVFNENARIENKENEKKISSSPCKKPITNKLTTAIKSSFKKNVHLDTELKLLSKEFRYLLSGKYEKAKEAKELLKEKIEHKKEQRPIEKKLNFSEQEKLNDIDINTIENNLQESEYEDMDDKEILSLENDILLKVLEENFGYKHFLPGQLETIKNILNYKNTLTILPPSKGKSLCYQLPSLVLEGLTIVICPLLASITDQLTNLPGCLSAASLTTFTNQNQRQEIMRAILLKKIKILFITPERFALENFTELDNEVEISLICLDDAICCSPLSQNFRSSYITICSMMKNLRPNSILLLGNNITNLIEESLLDLFNITKDNVIRQKLSFESNYKISISKDENKLSNLVKLLRNSNLKSYGTILIFCNQRKSVDKVTSFLNQNGLSASAYHAGKSEIERQLIQTNFSNDKIKILISTSGFCNGISKKDIRLVVLFDIPPGIDLFYQLLSRGEKDGKDTHIHVFLSDEDYFIQRNMILNDNVDKSNIRKFVEIIFSQCTNKKQSQAIFKVMPHKTNTENDNKENTAKKQSNKANTSEKVHKQKKSVYNSTDNISLNFNKIYESTSIKKNMQIFLLIKLLNDKKINSSDAAELTYGKLKAECLGIGPTDIHLRFFNKSIEDLSIEESNIKQIKECAKKLSNGILKFSTGDVCEKLGITYIDLINYLYCLQTQGDIGYETKDEGMFIKIEKIPENMNEIVDYLYYTNKYLVNLNIKKVNEIFLFVY